jgi:peptide/nickel transport system substrate-binding protein
MRMLDLCRLAALGAATLATAPALADTAITISTGQIFRSFDPADVSDQNDFASAANLYEPLITLNKEGGLAPDLAASWTASPDAKEIEFKLRPDARFSDGSPVTAADVVYTFARLLKINQGPANLFSHVLDANSVVAVDDHTVKVTLQKAFAPFLAAVPSVFIVNAKVVQANAGADDGQTYLASHVAGSGAYLVSKYDRGSGLTLVRDKNYYGGFSAHPIDEVRWVVTNDEATVKAMAASGELTMSSPFQAPDTYNSLEKMSRFKVLSVDTATGFYLKLNTQVAPTDDIHIRRALALATDYKTIREDIYPGGPLNGPIAKAFTAVYANDLPTPAFDMEAAKAEIAKSKYSGRKIPITLAYVANTKFEEEISLLMQSNLEQIGFVVTQQADPWNRITEIATKPQTSRRKSIRPCSTNSWTSSPTCIC